MKNLIFLLIVFSFAVSISYAQKRYYKGNTHTHCYPGSSGDITDTSYTAPKIIQLYKAKGYDFLVFTDHGAWWNAKILSTPDFTVIDGSEPGISGNGRWGHFTGLRMTARIGGSGLTHQQMIDKIFAQKAVPFINHPRYSQIPISALQIINDMKTNLYHEEIWNGVSQNSSGPDDITVWDSVLSTGRLMYGVACDDSHRESHQGKGWVMVYASSNHQDTLVEAIRRGDFYASTGIVIDTVSYSPEKIYVKSSNGEIIKFFGKDGNLLISFNGKEATYQIKGNELYVRAEVTNTSGKRGWIQPYFVSPTNSVKTNEISPDQFELYQNYPNPFNPYTTIIYTVGTNGAASINQSSVFVQLKIYDVLGKEVSTLVNDYKHPGTYQAEFNGGSLPGGVYYYVLKGNGFLKTKKLVLLK
jgi:hypothetical protein